MWYVFFVRSLTTHNATVIKWCRAVTVREWWSCMVNKKQLRMQERRFDWVLLFASSWKHSLGFTVQRARVHESFHFRFRWVIFVHAADLRSSQGVGSAPQKYLGSVWFRAESTIVLRLISNSTGEQTESMNVDFKMYSVRFKRIRTFWLSVRISGFRCLYAR